MNETTRKDQLRVICEEIIALKNRYRNYKEEPGTETPLPLYRVKSGVKPVIGEGDHYASIMFVGEAPGRTEAETGRPFSGAAGKVLDELFESAGMDRNKVYVTNILKDRPPGNRDPLPHEIEMYAPFLDRQIDIIQPRVIVTLGRFSMGYIFKKFGIETELQPISKMHGQIREAQAIYGPVKLLALYHPAVAVYNPNAKDELKKDFAVLKNFK